MFVIGQKVKNTRDLNVDNISSNVVKAGELLEIVSKNGDMYTVKTASGNILDTQIAENYLIEVD